MRESNGDGDEAQLWLFRYHERQAAAQGAGGAAAQKAAAKMTEEEYQRERACSQRFSEERCSSKISLHVPSR